MRVGFFVTCLVDLMRPSIGFAAIELIESGGAEVFVPPSQTCCGQPAYNSGDRADAKALAAKVVAEFEERSEERRVGKECRARWLAYHLKKIMVTIGP